MTDCTLSHSHPGNDGLTFSHSQPGNDGLTLSHSQPGDDGRYTLTQPTRRRRTLHSHTATGQ